MTWHDNRKNTLINTHTFISSLFKSKIHAHKQWHCYSFDFYILLIILTLKATKPMMDEINFYMRGEAWEIKRLGVCLTHKIAWDLMVGMKLGYSRKKWGRGGVDNMEFLGVLKKKQVHFPGVNQKQCEISMGDQEKIMWNFYKGVCFRP